MCEKLGVEPEFVEINWDTKVVELDAKSIDCIWNGMTLTDDIMANTATTKAYAKNAQVVVVKDGTDYSSGGKAQCHGTSQKSRDKTFHKRFLPFLFPKCVPSRFSILSR